MFILTFGVVVLIIYVIIQFVRFIRSDCDLTLQYTQYMGKSPAAALGTKVVWITGASSGIGEYFAYEMAAAGCRIILSARREDELKRVKKQCLLSGPIKDEDVLILPLDVLKFDSHKLAVEKALQHFKTIDVLVNNAGRSQRASWFKTELAVDRELLEVNVLGTLSLTKAVLPHMVERRDHDLPIYAERKEGHIVVVSSTAGKLGAPLSGSYTGTKHALQGWFESLRIEAVEYNIDITMVCPGPVFSNILSTAFTEEKDKEFGGTMDPTDKRVTTDRCASLMAVAVANKLDEVWIALHPILFFMYLFQYCPSIARKIGMKLGNTQIRKMREGRWK